MIIKANNFNPILNDKEFQKASQDDFMGYYKIDQNGITYINYYDMKRIKNESSM